MSNVLRMNGARRRNRKLVSTTVANAIDFSDGSGPPRMVAYPERELPPGGIPAYLAARKSGVRSFVLWADEDRRERVATVVTESAAGGVATFHVLGAHGEHLGTIVREKAFRGRGLRARWTVTPAGGPEAVGYKGRIVWWFVWWLCLPLMVVIVIFSVLDGVPGNEGGAARAPRRIRWRAGGRMPLEFRSRGSKLHLHAPETDWRLGAALVALVGSFSADMWDGLKT
ncbi:hypothetical protein ACFRMO_25425 [Streptomyces anulatus]|uniref:hypothetical protein n=1 Tax=Streptomyces TaxID=1883 RepID=UPI000ABA069E|nr:MULTISPECIES: hypothetical protein [Streptomyces]MDF9804776.1 hypothetical protein [Streptomyces sp. HB372]MBT1105497.1 hypothetical protein [Streptomyces sp. Tu10]WSC62323.1 hypothetical protein OHA57_16900 [Streptomyces anulatus]WTC72019.1 hypothetical protein OG882_17430 [Streptomyces anulatus]WUC88404.1 hypothetical protein OHQ35_20905 [Streptomyces anulatus]